MAITLPGADEIYGRRPEIRPSTQVADIGGPTGLEGKSAQFLGESAGDFDAAAKYIEAGNDAYARLQAESAGIEYQKKLLSQKVEGPDAWRDVRGQKAADPKFIQTNMERMNAARDEVANGLESPLAKRYFNNHIAPITLTQQSQLYEHSASQRMAWEDNNYKAQHQLIMGAASDAINNLAPGPDGKYFLNPVGAQLQLMDASTKEYIGRKVDVNTKEGNAVMQAAIQSNRDEVIGNLVNTVVLKDPEKAKALLDQFGPGMSANERLKLNHSINASFEDQRTRVIGKNTFDKLVNEVNNAPDKNDAGIAKFLQSVTADMKKSGLKDSAIKQQLEDGTMLEGNVNIAANGEWKFTSSNDLSKAVGTMPQVNSKVDYALLLEPGEAAARAAAEKERPGDAKFADTSVQHFKQYLQTKLVEQQAVQKKAAETVEQALFGVGDKAPPVSAEELSARVGVDIMRNLPAGSLHGIQVALEANQKKINGKLENNANLYVDLVNKTYSGEIKNKYDFNQYLGRGIDDHHLQRLRQEWDQANEGSKAVQQRLKKQFDIIDDIWKSTPGIMGNDMLKGAVKEQQSQWLDDVRTAISAVEGKTPQEREAGQLKVVEEWSKPEKLKEYQPNIVEGLKKDNSRIIAVQRAVMEQTKNPEIANSIPIRSKDPVVIKKMFDDAAPGQFLTVWDAKANNKLGDWTIVQKPLTGGAPKAAVPKAPAIPATGGKMGGFGG